MDGFYRKLLAAILITLLIAPGCNQELPFGALIPEPVASFTYSGTQVTPATITFQNTSQNSNIFRWDFGDGTESQIVSPTKTYARRGVYTVRLIAANATYFRYARPDTNTQHLNITPGKLFIDSVIVDRVPFVDPMGIPWESDSVINLEFLLSGSGGGRFAYLWGAPVAGVSPSKLPIIWHFDSSGRLDSWNRAYRIGLWDRVPYYPTYIGETNMFMIYDTIASSGYPTLLRLQDPRSTIKVRINLRWE